MNRRVFVSGLSLVGVGVAMGAEKLPEGEREISVFTKFLEALPYDELAKILAPLGVSGIEAPLRKSGHIEPESLVAELPVFLAALQQQNLKVSIMASSINQVDSKGLVEKQLRAAAGAGIKKYRLQHLWYDLKKPIKPQLAEFTAQLRDLAQLNQELEIQGLYQNHRGKNCVGGPVWDMLGILDEIASPHLGLAFDFAHATVEGTNAWELNFHAAREHIGAVFFKDYQYGKPSRAACPLGEGSVDKRAGKLVTQMLPKEIPAVVHIEYIRGEGAVPRTVAAMRNDVATLKRWFQS